MAEPPRLGGLLAGLLGLLVLAGVVLAIQSAFDAGQASCDQLRDEARRALSPVAQHLDSRWSEMCGGWEPPQIRGGV